MTDRRANRAPYSQSTVVYHTGVPNNENNKIIILYVKYANYDLHDLADF